MDINRGSTFEITDTRSRLAAKDRDGPGGAAQANKHKLMATISKTDVYSQRAGSF
jgi:hypothetical protein